MSKRSSSTGSMASTWPEDAFTVTVPRATPWSLPFPSTVPSAGTSELQLTLALGMMAPAESRARTT
ncbi:hypothetical protein D3C86_1315600 [compost metagenome]